MTPVIRYRMMTKADKNNYELPTGLGKIHRIEARSRRGVTHLLKKVPAEEMRRLFATIAGDELFEIPTLYAIDRELLLYPTPDRRYQITIEHEEVA